jgi:demethylmenaquinone methyltransferase/2-methoxy-6-polyprenyl-1,4-benzoquinol methylase
MIGFALMAFGNETTTSEPLMTMNTPTVPSRTNIHQMFDRISRRYDLLNHLLSLGLDFYWRRRAVDKLDRKPNQRILDLACGTGDLALAAARRLNNGFRVIAIDKAPQMLQLAADKIARRSVNSISLALGDGMALPIKDASLDAAMIAFGIRNMPDTYECLKEIHRLLNLGGKAVVLEFSLPSNQILRSLHRFYLRRFVPTVGRIVSGDQYAYRYLDQTIETYAQGEAFCGLMRHAGFVEVIAEPISFGIVTIYTGRKL